MHNDIGLTPEEREARKKIKIEAERIARRNRRDMQTVLKSKTGQRVLWGILADTRAFQTSFAGEATHTSAFNEGRRDVGLRLMERITDASPKAMLEMMQTFNAKDEEEKDDA